MEDMSRMQEILPRLDPILEIDQRSLTWESLTRKAQIILDETPIQNIRLLALGDFDMTGTILSVLSNPKDAVVMDIDERLAETLFDLQMTFNTPIRFVYHDVRKKMIEVLSNQFDLIITEPPPTKQGITLFLSRAINAARRVLMSGNEHNPSIFLALPKKDGLFEHLKTIATQAHITIQKQWEIIEYETRQEKGYLFKLRVENNSIPIIDSHYLGPLYAHEVVMEPQPWECQCGNIILVGKEGQVASLSSLQEKGCPRCNHRGVFRFASKIPIK